MFGNIVLGVSNNSIYLSGFWLLVLEGIFFIF